MRYFYKDIATEKVRFTRGEFKGWTEPTGLLNVPYAIFALKTTVLLIPKYALTKDTLSAIPAPDKHL
jgi:hypothetical protein